MPKPEYFPARRLKITTATYIALYSLCGDDMMKAGLSRWRWSVKFCFWRFARRWSLPTLTTSTRSSEPWRIHLPLARVRWGGCPLLIRPR